MTQPQASVMWKLQGLIQTFLCLFVSLLFESFVLFLFKGMVFVFYFFIVCVSVVCSEYTISIVWT